MDESTTPITDETLRMLRASLDRAEDLFARCETTLRNAELSLVRLEQLARRGWV